MSTFRNLVSINHSLFLMAFAAFFAHEARAVSITATATPVGAGNPTPITAEVTGGEVDDVYLVYRVTPGTEGYQSTWNTNSMTYFGGTRYTSSLPPLFGAITMEWYVAAGADVSATTSTTLAELPDYNRYHDGVQYNASTAPYGWRATTQSNYVAAAPNGSQWKASGVEPATRNSGSVSIDTSIGMAYPVLYFMNIPPSTLPYIRSPKLEGGVGTIDFRAKLAGSIDATEIKVQYAVTEDDPIESDWQDIPGGEGTYSFAGANVSKIIHIVLNDPTITYVRILRSQYNFYAAGNVASGRLTIDNICFSKPVADVRITEKLKNPGWPASDQDIRMRCTVENVFEETPAINRRVTVKYQYVARADATPIGSAISWNSADMAYMGKDSNGLDWYEGVIPTQKVGHIWYYYQVDYDGYNYGVNPITGASESLSPGYWDAGENTHTRPVASTSFEVRPFRSRYGRVKFDAQPANNSIEAMTLVDNEQWQCVTLMTDVPAVTNRFIGYQYYADDAEDYEVEPTIWSDNNPDSLSDPTIAGNLESSRWLGTDGITNSIVALNEKNYNGFYLYRFSSNDEATNLVNNLGEDKRYDYIVKKAVWQDFDDWTASPTFYETSLGGLPTLTFAENFDGNASSAASGAICLTDPWYQDEYADADSKREDFNDEVIDESDNEYQSSAAATLYDFIRTGSRVIKDRGINTQASTTKINQTLALQLDGQFENTSDSMPYGLEKLTFKARASVDDNRFVLNTAKTTQALPFYASATFQLTQVAPSKHYLSFVFLYQADLALNAFWYELRLIQTDSKSADDNYVSAELWRHDKDGTYKMVASANAVNGKEFKLNTSQTYNFYVANDNGVRVKVSVGGNNPSTSPRFNLKDSTGSYGNNTGTFGFGVFDAVPSITALKVGSSYNGTDIISSISATTAQWDTNLGTWSVGSAITRAIPQQTIKIFAADCKGGEYTAKPSAVSKTPVKTITVNSLSMQNFSVDFKAWNKKFAQIRYTDGKGGVVLDDIWYYPWRAVSRHAGNDAEVNGVSYLDWTTKDQQEEWLDENIGQGRSMRDRWAVLEGWTTKSTSGSLIGVNLVRTRANTNLVQGIVSPAMTNGIGSMNFSYSVTGGKVVYGIERSDRGNYHSWTPVAVFSSNAGASGEQYVKIGEYFGGRVRMRVYGENDIPELLNAEVALQDLGLTCGYTESMGYTDPGATIFVDNLKCKDYPEDINGNAWNAYNLLITSEAPDGQIYNNAGKSCFFNNSQTSGGYGAEQFLDDDPYLESPPLRGVGIGEIAFQYRQVPGTGTGNGNIIIKVAPDRDFPTNRWVTLTNVTVSASGNAFVKFDNEKIFDEQNYVVRFYNSTAAGTPKFILDNVLITAPARASFEFEYVKLLPEQPLVGSNVVVEAKIMREILSPKNIRVFCSYHTYEPGEKWGYKNWFDPVRSPRVELFNMGNKIYRSVGGGIPAGNVDEVVEYILWGTHGDIDIGKGDTPIVQSEETFECPEWYKTFDMDRKEVKVMDMNIDHAEDGWSPYYWVFSCAPGTFFVNEINAWRNRSSEAGEPEYIEFAAPAGTDISGWTFRITDEYLRDESFGAYSYEVPAHTTVGNADSKGWGFFVWGDEWAKDMMPMDAYLNGAVPNNPTGNRGQGSTDPQVENLGTHGTVSVFRSNGMVVDLACWGTESYVKANFAYGYRYASRKPSGNLNPLSMISLDDEQGETIAGKTVNDFQWGQVEMTPGTANGTGQVMADLTGGEVIQLKDPEGKVITDADILKWIEKYGAQQSDIDELTMAEFNKDFLMNLDITKDCTGELTITSIEISEGYVYLRVKLTRTENDAAVGKREINGILKILGADDLQSGFSVIGSAVIGDEKISGSSGITDAEIELDGDKPAAFFKATIMAE